jgi:hypothetical protein
MADRQMADMMRPWGKPDAILWHVASWGDRFPMAATTSKPGVFVNYELGSVKRDGM